jgi:hypothetical protein
MGLEITAKIFISLHEGANSGGTRSFYQKLGADPLRIEKNTREFLDCAFSETDFAINLRPACPRQA